MIGDEPGECPRLGRVAHRGPLVRGAAQDAWLSKAPGRERGDELAPLRIGSRGAMPIELGRGPRDLHHRPERRRSARGNPGVEVAAQEGDERLVHRAVRARQQLGDGIDVAAAGFLGFGASIGWIFFLGTIFESLAPRRRRSFRDGIRACSFAPC